MLNTDASFLIYRRFGYLRNRLLLDREIELAQLEVKLRDMDTEQAKKWPAALMTIDPEGYRDDESLRSFRSVMDKVHQKLNEYGRHLSA